MSLQNQNNQKRPKDHKDKLNGYAVYSGIAIQMFAIIGIGTYIGVKLDEYYPNAHKIYTVIGALLSVVFSIIYVIKRIIAASR